MKLLIKQGKVLVSAARRLLSIGTQDCPCCGPTGPLYMRFNPCGYPGGTPVWVSVLAVDPNAGAALLQPFPNGPLRCYCGSGVIKPLSEIPAGDISLPQGSSFSQYQNCCQCLGSAISDSPCQYAPGFYNGTFEYCCCSSVESGPIQDRLAIVGSTHAESLIDYQFGLTGRATQRLVVDLVYNGSGGTGTEVYTDTGDPLANYSRSYPLPLLPVFAPGGFCGRAVMEELARSAARSVPSVIFSQPVGSPNETYSESASATCTTGTFSSTYLYNDTTSVDFVTYGYRTYQYVTHQYTVIAKQTGAICDCYGGGVPGIEAVNAGNPLDFLPEP